MSPEMKRDFETEWPQLAGRLKSFLVRKQVAPDRREDLVQETALRLYGIWERVDRSRSAWALTATIALNLIRDEGRRNGHCYPVAEPPEVNCTDDVEQIALARVELRRIQAALAKMTAAQRAILLAEVGVVSNGVAKPGPATKMRRLRARRKLRQVLERALGLVVLPARRVMDAGQAFIALKDSFVRVGSCLACMVLGVGSMIALPPEIVVGEPAPDYGSVATGVLVLEAEQHLGSIAEIADAAFIPKAGAQRASRPRPRTNSTSGDEAGGTPTQLPLPKNPVATDQVSTAGPPDAEPPVPLPKVPPVPGNDPGDDPQSIDDVVSEVQEELDEVLKG
ncbi:MAG: RNA polymerase sigma factor [Actinomycetota bacterium]